MATISFKTKFDLSISPKQFVLEDTSDYLGQGIALADVNGCFKIVSPSGLVYYFNNDFSDGTSTTGCDIQVVVDVFNKIVIILPTIPGGDIEPGNYTITYSVYNKDTEETYTVTNSYEYTYVPKTISIVQTVDCLSPLFTSTDTTSYAISGATLTLIRQHTIDFPFGSPGEGAPISGPLASYPTSDFWNGTQTTEIGSSVQYEFADGLIVQDYLTGVKEILVACEDTCAIMCCVKANEVRLNDLYTSNRAEYNMLLPKYNLAVTYLVLIMQSQRCGQSQNISDYLTKIKTLLNCTDDCCSSSDVPTKVVGLGFAGITVVNSGGSPVTVTVVVAGSTTTYTVSLDEAFVDKVNNSYNSIVEGGDNASVSVVTNPDGTKTYTIDAKKAIVVAGNGITVTPSAEVAGVITYTVTNNIDEGDNISFSGSNPIVISGKATIVAAGAGITVTPSGPVAGVMTYTVEATGTATVEAACTTDGTPQACGPSLTAINGADFTPGVGEGGDYIFFFNGTFKTEDPWDTVECMFQMRNNAVLTGVQQLLKGVPLDAFHTVAFMEPITVADGETVDVVMSSNPVSCLELQTVSFTWIKVG